MPLSLTLALRNLFHDRLRFIATLIGIVFSVVLVLVQMGLYSGFGRMVTMMIDHAATDLWVVSRGTNSMEDISQFDSGIRDKVLAIDGVAEAVPLVIGFSDWHLPEGGERTPVFIVGSDPKHRGLEPWNVVEGAATDLSAPDAVAVDRSYYDRLGISGMGSTAEINQRKVKVAVVTDGIRSFTTMPYVFSGLDAARTYLDLPPSKISQILVRVKHGTDLKRVRDEIQSKVSNVEVLTPQEFRQRSRTFWLFSTGAGAALFAGVLLGVIVGTAILAQTLYSNTREHLPEFAALRAIGCSNRYIFRIIRYQALLNAAIGLCLAGAIGAVVVYLTAKSALPIIITPLQAGGLVVIILLMCLVSAIVAIARVVRIDPVTVLTR
ncbi:MAG TPA: ABC transporter permease [Xanthobacteraceae bacterium]|jgi:putative ABC transport system permease protein|nr:ABC transporter permease [Xanthobacteraceae bacterium]